VVLGAMGVHTANPISGDFSIGISGLSMSFVTETLFTDAGFNINKKERIGLVGRNGSGKTTLFNLITGGVEPEEGTIDIPRDYRIGYVKQNISPNIPHLHAALLQWGPWKNQDVVVDRQWLEYALAEKITRTNWREAATDVERFLSPQEQHSLKLWSDKFFLHKVDSIVKN